MNKKGAALGVKGFALITVFILLMIALFATIDPLKENLNNARDTTSLNCPGTAGFNQIAYDAQSTYQKINVRPVCFVTGLSLVWFFLAFLIAAVIWLARNLK